MQEENQMTGIQICDYSKTIKGNCVLNQVNLEIEEGTAIWLTGRNGSGKTMLLRAISGLISPDRGSVAVFGKKLTRRQPFPASVGMVIAEADFWNRMTGFETLKTLASIRNQIGKEEIEQMMHCMGLQPGDRRKVGKYSLGMKKRLAIVQAVMEHPRLLLLDEPTNGLDGEGVERFRKLIWEEKEKGTTIIIASHVDDNMRELFDRIIVMEDGCVSEGDGL